MIRHRGTTSLLAQDNVMHLHTGLVLVILRTVQIVTIRSIGILGRLEVDTAMNIPEVATEEEAGDGEEVGAKNTSLTGH